MSGTYDLDGVSLRDRYVGGSPVDSNPAAQVGDSQEEIAALDGRMTAVETDVYTAQGDIDAAEGRLDAVEADVYTAQGDIDAVEGDVAILQVGGVGVLVATATDYACDAQDFVVKATAACTVTLPTAVGIMGKWYVVKNAEGGSDSVDVATTSSQTIDGVAAPLVLADGDVARLMSDGANWILI